MTPTLTPPAPAARPPRDRVTFAGVSWEAFRRLRRALRSDRSARFAYDRGELEIMTVGPEHDQDSSFLGHLIEVLTEELDLPIRRGGSMTIGRRRLKKAIEPDRCFWIGNAAAVAGLKRLDFRIHPPPDLAIEVDVTSSSINRFGVYAKLGIGELWRLDGDDLRFHTLGTGRKYAESATSPTFPGLTPAELIVFLRQARAVVNQNVVTRAFRAWVRAEFGRTPPPANDPAAGGEPAAG